MAERHQPRFREQIVRSSGVARRSLRSSPERRFKSELCRETGQSRPRMKSNMTSGGLLARTNGHVFVSGSGQNLNGRAHIPGRQACPSDACDRTPYSADVLDRIAEGRPGFPNRGTGARHELRAGKGARFGSREWFSSALSSFTNIARLLRGLEGERLIVGL